MTWDDDQPIRWRDACLFVERRVNRGLTHDDSLILSDQYRKYLNQFHTKRGQHATLTPEYHTTAIADRVVMRLLTEAAHAGIRPAAKPLWIYMNSVDRAA